MADRSRDEASSGGANFGGMSRAAFLKVAGATGVVVTASGGVITLLNSPVKAQAIGEFGPLFVEPIIYVPSEFARNGKTRVNRPSTDIEDDCIERENKEGQTFSFCKPAAGQNGLLPDGRFLYMNALEGTEDNERIAFDADTFIQNDQSRVLKINYTNNKKSQWLRPKRPTGGVEETPTELIPGLTVSDDEKYNNGAFFCAHQCHLPNGCVLVVGGTLWYQEGPGTPADPLELEGLNASRFFDYKLNKWVQTNDMNIGRWYPAVIPLPNGDPLVMGGVFKLVKPVYVPPEESGEPQTLDSGGNVREVERFDLASGEWVDQGEGARKSLPLMPRIHLLPNGHVSYNGAGQAFNPLGQDPEQPTWNFVATFDPEAQLWIETGLLAGTGSSFPGSKLSTTEVPLMLEPDDDGNYTKLEILNGGGTSGLGVLTNPGSFFPNNHSRIDTFDTTKAPDEVGYYTSEDTDTMFSPTPAPDAPELSEITPDLSELPGGLELPGELPELPVTFGLGRWYGDAVLLPDGKVFVSSGGDRDEVVFPGNEFPILECEVFDRDDKSDHPNGSWKVVGEQTRARTYHNTNSLLPTGQILIGGHAPIPFGYVSHDSDVIPGTRNEDGRDPTFQIWDPPYISDRNRPKINVKNNGSGKPLRAEVGGRLTVPTSDGADVEDVVIMKIPSTTHINDTEQRGLVLPVIRRNRSGVTARMPKTLAELGGPGFYLAFIRNADKVPSEGVFVKVPKRGPVTSS
jgi:hypothetical protein